MTSYIFELYCPWTHKVWFKRRIINAPDDNIEKILELVSRIAGNKYPFIIYDNEYKELYKSPCKDM